MERVPLSNTLRADPDYADPIPGIEYDGRQPDRAPGGRAPGAGALCCSIPTWTSCRRRRGRSGRSNRVGAGRRGARARRLRRQGPGGDPLHRLAALRRLGVRLQGDVLAHLVVEEEVGGNGTLAMARRGEQADGCIVMEPTDLRILSSVRGAVWFRVICTGKPGHSGRAGDTVSALKMAIRVIDILEQYHARLLAVSRGIPLFDSFANPMPITFGKLQAGDWPATAPARAVVEGVLGLLPNKTRYQVMDEMRQAIVEGGDAWLREHFRLEFMYRHDSHVLDPGHPLVRDPSSGAAGGGGGRRSLGHDGLLRLLVLQQPARHPHGRLRPRQPGLRPLPTTSRSAWTKSARPRKSSPSRPRSGAAQ